MTLRPPARSNRLRPARLWAKGHGKVNQWTPPNTLRGTQIAIIRDP
jgi:hypothetical protein